MAVPLGIVSALNRDKKEIDQGVHLTVNESARRVDVTVDGKPFTSYVWPDTIKKPVLYPLRSSTGAIVTRGFPLDPRPGERVDHPHHVGLWFNYGNVNGVDFWNNSDSVKPDPKHPYGTILHRKIVRTVNGKDRGELDVEMDWLMPDGSPVLREDTRFIFRAGANLRAIDRLTTLTALDKKVQFSDDKEGVLGIRVARSLELPADKPEVFTDSSGKPTTVPEQRGLQGRRRLGDQGKMGNSEWERRTAASGARYSRSSQESGIPDVLACAGIRFVRRQSPRRSGIEQRERTVELRHRSRALSDLQISRSDYCRNRADQQDRSRV